MHYKALRSYFDSGATKEFFFRKEQLKKLKASILNHEQDLYDALYADLKKSPEETWVTETGMVIAELNAAIKQSAQLDGAGTESLPIC